MFLLPFLFYPIVFGFRFFGFLARAARRRSTV
jgi:hypothetical protein